MAHNSTLQNESLRRVISCPPPPPPQIPPPIENIIGSSKLVYYFSFSLLGNNCLCLKCPFMRRCPSTVYLVLLYQPTGLMPGDDCGDFGGWGADLFVTMRTVPRLSISTLGLKPLVKCPSELEFSLQMLSKDQTVSTSTWNAHQQCYTTV